MNIELSFSIVTPVYNREDCILRCLNSVGNQNFYNVEHIVIDDGSTDKTAEYIKMYAKSHRYISYYSFKKNKGVNAARNYGIKQCKKKYVLFLDSDDYLCDNALSIIAEKINLYPGYLHYLFSQDDRADYYNANSLLKNKTNELEFNNWIKDEITGDFFHVMSLKMIQQFPFNEKLRIYEELNFMQMYKYSQKQRFINITVEHRERSRFDSVTKEATLINSNAIQSQFEFLKLMIENYEADYRKFNLQKLNSMIKKTLIFSLALSDYNYYKYQSKRVHKSIPGGSLICVLNLGCILKHLIMVYSRIKHL